MSAEVPVAIIGLGGRFPGGSDTPTLFYDFLRNKGDGMVEPPSDRWDHAEWSGNPGEPGKYCAAKAGFISDIDRFDPFEFGISTKEADRLDPAVRLTLEAAHDALQDAGIDYRGSKTGVFFGNLLTTMNELDTERYEVNSYDGTGRCVAIRANRISFAFDLRGPSLTVDTACSASATAMHIALNSIKLGDCDQALVVGANTIINPEHTVSFSKLGVLSPTGSSKSFDASADGYARAECSAAVLIKRLDHVKRDGDSAYAVITGSAVNANGKGKSLTMPEGAMQAETIKAAYAAAKRDPADAFFVELHATGTKVGDPIEANAAGFVFSQGRADDRTLRVGSVKANIGHAEGCSFLASLFKVAMMLNHKEIIPNIRFNIPNPAIDFVGGKMRVQTELEKITHAMTAPDGKWVTSISSYGVGGANAHVVIESFDSSHDANKYTAVATLLPVPSPLYLFSVGTLTESSIGRWEDALMAKFDGTSDDRILRSVARDLSRQARAYPARAFAVAPSLGAGTKFSKPVLSTSNASLKLALVFSGQGPQHVYMGRQLAAIYPAFLESVRKSDSVLVEKYSQGSMLERTGLFIPDAECMLPANGQWPVRDVVLSLVSFQIALVDLIRDLGVTYQLVIGHSVGEIAMGYASGHYDREMAIGIAVARAAAMTKAEGNGAMVALGVDVQKAKVMIRKVLSRFGATSGLWIAGINSPQAVTVAGTHELIDALIELAADPQAKVFAAKLRVGCAFHTPLMESQEVLFKARVSETALSQGTKPPVARVMSTTDGCWLDRDLDVDYCWDNVRRPVLFGTAINRMLTDYGADNLLFLEIAPHPVLKTYIEQCGGEPISLVKRPNPKTPAQNMGEHYQLLEGIGHLLSRGYKHVDFDKLYASPDGTTGSSKPVLPNYPYNKLHSWYESASGRSIRLRQNPRPLASHHFRINVDSHPDLTGHVVFDAVLFPASGYIESILENGAMVVSDVSILKPFVLEGTGTYPSHAGCVIDADKWQFKASTTKEFINGDIILDTIYATGLFSRNNPSYNPSSPRTFDIQSKLSKSRGSCTGDEFYDCIPSAYRYQGHFRDYLREIHEVEDERSWGSTSYLARFEISAGAPDVYGNGYCIHPGILDSVTQCGLAMFINMETKRFDFNGIFLPVKIDAFRRWDSADAPNLDSELQKGLWVYLTARSWVPEGPFRCDYVVANSEGRVLFTIDGFEIALAPADEPIAITDDSREQRLTTVWQTKHFPVQVASTPSANSLAEVFDALVRDAVAAGRKVIRVVDVMPSSDIAKSLDVTLQSLLADVGVVIEYFCAARTPEEADVKTSTLEYPHVRSLCLQSYSLQDEVVESVHTSFDIVIGFIDISRASGDIPSVNDLIVPSGVALLVAPHSDVELNEEISLDRLAHILTVNSSNINVSSLRDGQTLVVAQFTRPTAALPADSSRTVIISPFEHGREAELVSIAQNIAGDSEFWITGNDDAADIGALGIASCLIAEMPDFEVHSILFEDHALDDEARENIVHELRKNTRALEQHMKISKEGDVLVRRLVRGTSTVRERDASAVQMSMHAGKPLVSAYFPPKAGDNEVEIEVECVGGQELDTNKSLIAFAGTVRAAGSSVTPFAPGTVVVGLANGVAASVLVVPRNTIIPLPTGVTASEAVALLPALMGPWIALMVLARIDQASTVLIHDAYTPFGLYAVQLAQRYAGRVFCTVSSETEAISLSMQLGVQRKHIAIIHDFSDSLFSWSVADTALSFDVVLNAEGKPVFAGTAIPFSMLGCYIHNRASEETPTLPLGAPFTHLFNASRFYQHALHALVPAIFAMLAVHASQKFVLRTRRLPFDQSEVTGYNGDTAVIHFRDVEASRVDPAIQLFDPRKSYILLGGCSELGVRVMEWMARRGARHIYMTSRRGAKGLTKVDNMYIRYFRSKGIKVEPVAADAASMQDTAAVIQTARESGPIGGVFVMSVVLRDAKFTNLNQSSFDDVYHSKVTVLNTLLRCVDPASLDFILLFSTIGSVFGNAGQAAYCASQLYLDRIADVIPNTISISIPPITDSGIFKRLLVATKGKANATQLGKAGMTSAQVCNFIGDALIRRITHYVPMLAINDVAVTFPSCEPKLFHHLLPKKLLVASGVNDKDTAVAESPGTLLATLLNMEESQMSDNALITSYGLDSLAATRYSNLLKSRFNISASQIELLGTMTLGALKEIQAKAQASSQGDIISSNVGDGSIKYGDMLAPILSNKLAYGEPYTTDASPHQYRIWLAQREYDNARKRSVANIDNNMLRYGATQWDTHEGYFVTIRSESPIDIRQISDALQEVLNRHGALRTSFSWNEELGKLQQIIYPSIELQPSLIDLSDDSDAFTKAYEMSIALNKEPNFSLDRLPLLNVMMFNLGGGHWAFNVVTHHIIIDEASLGIFFYELFHIYLHGSGALPEVPIHYSDFSDWLAKTSNRRSELKEEHLKFWASYLPETEPLYLSLATPSERELSPITQIEAEINARALERYSKIINNSVATPFTGFFAAYNILLHKYSGQHSFVVGTATTQRNLPQLQNVIGFFANMLPIRTVVDDSLSFVDYLSNFKADLLSCLAHDEVTYEDIVALRKGGAQGRGYFKHLFAPGGMNMETISQLGVKDVHQTSLPNGEEQYEFLLTVYPSTGQIILRFDNKLYTEDAARQLLGAYVRLIETFGHSPDVRIRDVPIVSEREHHRLTTEFSSSDGFPVYENCLHKMVEEQTEKTPCFTAVEFEDQSLTYAELNATANRVARSLIQQGVHPGDVVALCFDRGLSQIMGILSVLKTGATFVPLDPDDPIMRKEMVIQECGVKILVTTASHSRSFPESLTSKVVIAYIDDPSYQKRLSRFSPENIEVDGLTPSSLAYILFTSGSTGKPKGVIIEHRSIANLVQNSSVYGFKQGTRVLSSLTYTFDPFIVDVFGSLTHGATLITGRKELVLGDISTAIRTLRINVLHVTPSILSVVAVDSYPTLETIVVAGEALGKKLIEDWSRRVTLRNMYGPTEASVDCISCHVTSTSLVGVIGRPLPNCMIYILDSQLLPVPVGVEGDLYIGGVQLARGYLNQPELTARSFIVNPFVSGERIYRTGDIALWRADGNIEYCGRSDRQIKLRGQRVELTEIEDVISNFSVVQRTAVIIRDVHDAPAVVAFVEFNHTAGEHLNEEKDRLKIFVSERLPRFMYPSLIAILPHLPTLASGKTDRSALKLMDLSSFISDISQDVGEPQGDVEVELVSIFSKMLHADSQSFGVTHDLFAVGMNSLMAVRAAGIISKKFNVHIGLSNIYLRPTIRELSNLIIDTMTQNVHVSAESEENDEDFIIEVLPVKKKGTQPKFFIVHDVTGMATPFMRLGSFMPNEIYTIGDKYFGSASGFDDIETMAEHYLKLVKSVQPTGPYLIGGYSFGGVVALCMASKLALAGEVVTHLILFDPIFIPSHERQLIKAAAWTQRSLNRLSSKFTAMGEKWRNKLKTEIRKNLDLLFDHEPAYYAGPTTLIVPKDRSWFRSGNVSDFDTCMDDHNGWDARIEHLDMKITAGAHDTMFARAYVKILAGVVKEIIASSLAVQSSSSLSHGRLRDKRNDDINVYKAGLCDGS